MLDAMVSAVLSSFRLSFRSTVNCLISGYALAVLLAQKGIGSSGVANLSEMFRFIGFDSVSSWLNRFYSYVINAANVEPKAFQVIASVVVIWMVLTCVSLAREYWHGPSVNITPNCAFAVLLSLSLCFDFFPQTSIPIVGLLIVLATLVSVALRFKENSEVRRLVEMAILLSMMAATVYIIVAPPIWLATKSDRSGPVGGSGSPDRR